MTALPAAPRPGPSPARPVPAVIAVVAQEGAVLLVQRSKAPDAGLWGFPGGRVEAGETVFAAAERELHEETGITARADDVLDVLDILDRDEDGGLRFHYVLIAVRCAWQAGTPVAGDDALQARWVRLAELDAEALALSQDVARLAHLMLDGTHPA
ncbi:NUDIX hydrolase [Pseudooceanicola sp. CBS1P-1]|uniref:NUDIX domain-containing protein n=1 Tax=Pseudooceanicola albus TaxID=2692189 RepID=A0A6L7FZM0_9RHOB|nr:MULTISPECIES: NUDIX hydrolase [Pseudooceanicola]MBT9382340.1 NUDIX hydrolase [Pseudooceanicola endophyticus]MXN16882.1 NUDIX domain-containing protein [Pseudooceanicola albus]